MSLNTAVAYPKGSIQPGFRLIDGSDIIDILAGRINFSNISMIGLLYESATDAIVAFAGGGQASATLLSSEINRIGTVATAGDSVALPLLPAGNPGLTVVVINHGANPMQVFGSGTDKIDDVATGTGVSQMAGSVVIYTSSVAGNWYSEGLATGYFGSFMTQSAQNALTAFAGGGQASGTLITGMLARFTTVATIADSGKLPLTTGLPVGAGLSITVTNAAANSMNIFPGVGDQINALGANAAFAIAGTKTVTFTSVVAGQWHTILTA